MEISTALWALKLGKDFTFFLLLREGGKKTKKRWGTEMGRKGKEKVGEQEVSSRNF